jgi:hypothetical protein
MGPLIAGLCFLVGGHAGHQAGEQEQTEPQKIEALIRHVETLSDAEFVRNGVAYDGKTAGQFLRGKWKAQEADVKTAKDFIAKVATKSSTTGQPYLIRLPGGRELPSGEYLAAELKKFEGSQ